MKTSLETLGRLLTAFEQLTSEETTVLREENFDALPELETRKQAVFAALRDLLIAVGFGRLPEDLRQRFRAVIELGNTNAARLARGIQQARSSRQTLETAGKRLRALGQTYGGQSARVFAPATFCAQV